MCVFGGEGFLHMENEEACGDTLMNCHWEELIGKLEELLHSTDDPDNYGMHIRQIIQYSSDGEQRFLRLHVIKRVQGVIEAMSSSDVSGCASTLVDFQQQLVKRADWIYPYVWSYENRPMNSCSIVNEAFDQALRDHPDLDAVNAQVIMSVSQSSDSHSRIECVTRYA